MQEKKQIKSNTLYRKIDGQFVAVSEELHVVGWSDGFYLVEVKPGVTSMARALSPDYAELECAFKVLEEEFAKGLQSAMAARPPMRASPKFKKAFKEFKKTLGNDLPVYLEIQSVNDIVREGFAKFFEAYTKYKENKVNSDILEI